MYKKSDHVCKWFCNGEGICGLNGSFCMNPFCEEGCRIQNEEIFHVRDVVSQFEKDDEPLKILTTGDIHHELKTKGRLVSDYLIPYSAIDEMNVSPSLFIKEAIRRVREKYDEADFYDRDYYATKYIYQNVEFSNGELGIYVIKT